MIGWFGKAWGAPICEDTNHVPTPMGERCLLCEEPIGEYDRGVTSVVLGAARSPSGRTVSVYPIHLECHIRSIVGGINHQRGSCRCCGGTDDPDPPRMTRREAARAALDYWRIRSDPVRIRSGSGQDPHAMTVSLPCRAFVLALFVMWVLG